MYKTPVFALLAQCVGMALAHFTWEIVEARDRKLNFYDNGVLTFSQHYASANDIRVVTYDPVNNRVFFADENNGSIIISSYDIATAKTQSLVRDSGYIYSLAYDPPTESLFWIEGPVINTFSLKSGSNQAIDGNRVIEVNGVSDIAVDSCSGYVYWITDKSIERARFDGSEREVLIDNTVNFTQLSLAIDHNTQKMYWSENYGGQYKIKSANLNGTNGVTLPFRQEKGYIEALTISNDFFYWKGDDNENWAIWKLPKNPFPSTRPVNVEPDIFFHSNLLWPCCRNLAAKYTINEQTVAINHCERLKGLIPKNLELNDNSEQYSRVASPTRVPDTNDKEKEQGSTGATRDTSICQNYCFQGDCNVSAEGQPKCSCKAGYSEQRCEVYACHGYCLHDGVCALDEDEPVCQCNAGYEGERCDVSVCKDYCLQGNCSVSVEGQAECSCNAGYSGQRCEVNACHGFCLNDGVCDLDEEEEPACQCSADYEGERCEDLAESRNLTEYEREISAYSRRQINVE